MSSKLLIVGISGVTCGGKTTLARQLNKIFPNSRIISQDDYFFHVDDPRHTWIPELNHINFDILSSLDMEKMYSDVCKIVENSEVITTKNRIKNEETNNISGEIREFLNKTDLKLLIVEGFSIFNYKPLLPLFDLKYYFTLSKDECYKRRITRVYDPPDCEGYFDLCVWPEYLTHLSEVKTVVTDLKYFDEYTKNCLEQVLADIMNSSQ